MGLTLCLKNECGKYTLPYLGATGVSPEIVTLQRTLPGWVQNTTVCNSVRHARAYPKTGWFTCLQQKWSELREIELVDTYLKIDCINSTYRKKMRCW